MTHWKTTCPRSCRQNNQIDSIGSELRVTNLQTFHIFPKRMSMADSSQTTDCPNRVGLKRSRCDDDKTASSSSSSSDSSWKTMYEDEHTKNTMLNLQLCFVQSECMRLLNLQSDMAGSIATLQVRYSSIPLSIRCRSILILSIWYSLILNISELSRKLDRRCGKRRRIRLRRRRYRRSHEWHRRNSGDIRWYYEWIRHWWRGPNAKETGHSSQASQDESMYHHHSIN